MTSAPKKIGRPSTYKPEYCEQLISLMSEGLSLMAACGEMDIVKSTAHRWAHEHPEFQDAIALGHAKRSAKLERTGLKAESGPIVTYITKALPNCNPDAFREKQAVELLGEVTLNHKDAAADEARRKLAALIAPKKGKGVDSEPDEG